MCHIVGPTSVAAEDSRVEGGERIVELRGAEVSKEACSTSVFQPS